jgi:hypothetical protein
MQRAGATIIFDYQLLPIAGSPGIFKVDITATPPGPAWLRNQIGDDYFRDVVRLGLDKCPIAKADLARLADFPRLEVLSLNETQIFDRDSLTGHPVQDSDLPFLTRTPRLRYLNLSSALIDGSGLASLVSVRSLKHLDLDGTRLDDEGMKQVGKLTALEYLALPGTKVTDAGLDMAVKPFIERFVRALVPPGPGARTTWKDTPYAILAAEKIDGAKPYAGAAGEVIGRDDGGILVKSGDTFLRLTRWAQVQPDGSLGAATVPNALRGQRLGRDLKAQLARAEARIALLESRLGSGASGD